MQYIIEVTEVEEEFELPGSSPLWGLAMLLAVLALCFAGLMIG